MSEKKEELFETKSIATAAPFLMTILEMYLKSKGSSTNMDIGEVLKALQGLNGGAIDLSPRSLYELIDAGILDKKIATSPEAEAFLAVLRKEILEKK